MLPVVWSQDAADDLAAIVSYILEHNRPAAIKLRDRILSEAERLSYMPLGGRSGRVSNTREWVAHPNYVIVYRVHADNIEILAVLHARQQYP